MLAPASLRQGPPSGGSDRRRSARLVAITLTCAVLAVLVPVLLAAEVVGDDVAGRAAGTIATSPSGPSEETHQAAVLTTGTQTPVPTTASSSVPETTETPTPAADPVVPAVDPPATSTPVTEAPVTEASAPSSPDASAEDPVSGQESAGAANWMEALRPQVDPEGLASWVFQAHGAWGASDGHTVYIDPDVPEDKRWSVMVHEYGHVLQVHRYGSLDATAVAMSDIVGASPMEKGPTESNADCIAELLGATWTDYGCQDALRPAAAALVADDAGRRDAALAARS